MKSEPVPLAIFDCDGVVLQSNHLKSDAFARALDGEPAELVDQFIAYHKAHGGISRYRKFDHYFRTIRPAVNPDIAIEHALGRYAQIVEAGLLNCPEVPGVTNALERVGKTHNVYLVSGGDQAELRKVFVRRGLDRYFHGIFGSPSTKYEILSNILSHTPPGIKAVYFGDSALDMTVAEDFGMKFVYVAGTSEWREGRMTCKQKGLLSIEDFTETPLDWEQI